MNKRRKKLIDPSLQLRLSAVFLCTAGLAVQIEAILITVTMTQLAKRMPTDGIILMTELPRYVWTNLLLTLAALAPLTLAVGILATFRIAGPLHRFEQFLKAVRDGHQIEPCRIRKEDELQDFCTLLNEATAPLRERASAAAPKLSPDEVESLRSALPADRGKSAELAPPPGAGSRGSGTSVT